MKYLLFISLFLFVFFETGNAQVPSWDWARQARGLGSEEGAPVITDAQENVYIAGGFTDDTIHFGAVTLANVYHGTFTSDAFLAKYDSSGNVIWAVSAGGMGHDFGGNMVLDSSGNIYLVGWFYSPSIIFGSDTLFNHSPGTADIFFVKYTTSGNVVWAKGYGGNNYDFGGDICSDASGNIYMAGKFYSPSVIFDSDTIYNSGLVNMFIAKFDTSGNVIWLKSANGNGSDSGNRIACDGFGNIYLTGNFSSTVINFGTCSLNNTGQNNVFVVKYDSSGTSLWARGAIGNGDNQGVGLASDFSGNIFAVGIFNSSSITFGSYTLFNSSGGYEPYIVKYDASGNVIWVRCGSGQGYGFCAALDAHDNIYVTGNMLVGGGGAISFDTVALFSAGGEPMYIVKYDSSGNALFGKALDFGGDDASGVTVGRSGNVYIAGDFLISPAIVGNDTMTQLGGETIFLAKLSYPTNPTESIFQIENPESGILLSPNPATSTFTIHTSLQFQNGEVEIFNVLGKKVGGRQYTMDKKEITIDVHDLGPGIYFVKVQSDPGSYREGSAVQKLVIQ